MSEVRSEIERYLEEACPGAELSTIAGDASTRRFYRVRTPDGGSRVLVDYGLSFEGETDDVRLARVFREADLRVAEIFDVCGVAGCLLVEDLGDTRLESVVAEVRPALERAVLLAAQVAVRGTEALARSDRRDGPVLDTERFRYEMDYFLEHYIQGLCGIESPPEALGEGLHTLADRAADTPKRILCHRDYHSRNLMVAPDGSLAMVDIQDARWGPDTYDLASLLRDGYIDIDEAWIDPLVDLYLSALDDPPAEGFRTRLIRVSAQRMIKALGTFGYQVAVRNDRRYLAPIPRTLARLDRILPELPENRPLHTLLKTTSPRL